MASAIAIAALAACGSDVTTSGEGGSGGAGATGTSSAATTTVTAGSTSSTSTTSSTSSTSTTSSSSGNGGSSSVTTSSSSVTTGVGGAGGGFDNGETVFEATSEGDPEWEIVDWQHYSAPMGDFGSNFGELIETLERVWGLHQFYPGPYLLGPGEVHAPPYGGEIVEGVLAAGFDAGNRFRVEDWTAPRGLILSATIIPTANAASGSSTDFADGPIIPTSLFPIYVDADLFRNGTLVDAEFDSEYPTVDSVPPGVGVDGYSHMTLTFGENTEYISGEPALAYEYRVTLTDASGASWTTTIPFSVE